MTGPAVAAVFVSGLAAAAEVARNYTWTQTAARAKARLLEIR